jgi:hypothetical protein
LSPCKLFAHFHKKENRLSHHSANHIFIALYQESSGKVKKYFGGVFIFVDGLQR